MFGSSPTLYCIFNSVCDHAWVFLMQEWRSWQNILHLIPFLNRIMLAASLMSPMTSVITFSKTLASVSGNNCCNSWSFSINQLKQYNVVIVFQYSYTKGLNVTKHMNCTYSMTTLPLILWHICFHSLLNTLLQNKGRLFVANLLHSKCNDTNLDNNLETLVPCYTE